MKKAFTLIELLSVIIILGIILTLTIPTVLGIINKSKDNAYNSQIENIINAAKFYISDEKDEISDLENIGDVYYVTLTELNNNGYLEIPIINPKTDAAFEVANSYVKVRKTTTNSFTYEFLQQ